MNAKNFDEVYAAVYEYAETIAKNLNMTVKVEKTNSGWGDLGKAVIVWHKKNDLTRRCEFRTRFGNPRIDLHCGEDFGSVEIGRGYRKTGKKDKYGYDELERDSVYRPKEIQAWGVMGLSMATEMWNELSMIIHKPANGYIDE